MTASSSQPQARPPGGTPPDSGDLSAARGRLRAAAEALSVLQDRRPDDQQRACRFAVSLLISCAEQADWRSAGLLFDPAPPPRCNEQLPAGDAAVLGLACCALRLQEAGLSAVQRAVHWSRLVAFLAPALPEPEAELVGLREMVLRRRNAAGQTSPEVVRGLRAALAHHRSADGEDAYGTAVARTALAAAYLERRTGSDLARAAALLEAEVAVRSAQYGARHPATTAARSLRAECLVIRAEQSVTKSGQRTLASAALEEIAGSRVVSDQLHGAGSAAGTRLRLQEARAAILLGDLHRARACLEFVLVFDRNREAHGMLSLSQGYAHLQLARLDRDAGDNVSALGHARQALQTFSAQIPGGRAARDAAALAQQLSEANPTAGEPGRRLITSSARPATPTAAVKAGPASAAVAGAAGPRRVRDRGAPGRPEQGDRGRPRPLARPRRRRLRCWYRVHVPVRSPLPERTGSTLPARGR